VAVERGAAGDGGTSSDPGLTSRRRSLTLLVRDLAEGSAELVRQEVRLVRLELSSLLAAIARGAITVAAGSVLVLLGTLAVLAGIVFLIGEQWIVGPYWLGALVVFVIAGAAAWVFAARGRRLLSPDQLVPRETVATLKEDSEWLKRRLT
jgi:putative superfamily III holin-X